MFDGAYVDVANFSIPIHSGQSLVKKTFMNSSPSGSIRSDATEPTRVVGVGSSAGGLESIETMFARIPADTRMAFVVAQHMSPDVKSFMDEIVRRHTEMAVFRVTEGMPVRSNAIYLIPPRPEMILSHGCLLMSDKDRNETLTLPIDHVFRSVATDCESRAIAVVLSGSGTDGSRGVRDIHQHGELVMRKLFYLRHSQTARPPYRRG